MELRIYIRQAIEYDITTFTPVWYGGNNPASLYQIGYLPNLRRWGNWNGQADPVYIDVTDFVSDLHKLSLTWTTDRDQYGNITSPGITGVKKSTSASLNFERDAYEYLKSWLIEDVSAPLNSVDVKIEHVGCGVYENYSIKATDIEFCEVHANCSFDVTLKQKDEIYACVQRTLVSDNWQGWFQTQPNGGKKHPRFSYCNEIRPNSQLIIQWYFMSLTAFIIFITSIIIATVINPIVLIVNLIISALQAIGIGKGWKKLKPYDPFSVIDDMGIFYLETAGCGREHPAPLIRDYISNVCAKCGVKVDETTAPIFFADTLTLTTSDPNRQGSQSGYLTVDNPYKNACYLLAQTERGIRRYDNWSPFGGGIGLNTTDFYQVRNAPLQTLDMFLNDLNGLFNTQWQIKTINIGGQNVPYLYIQRKDFYLNPNGTYVFDFSAQGADRMKLIEGICYTWNGKTTPASMIGIYAQDPIDTCGNEARTQMNDIVSFGYTQQNPNISGITDKRKTFGATKFRLDGASTDYITDAMQVCFDGSVFAGIFLLGAMQSVVKPALQEYADYALLLKDETHELPKVLIWDGASYTNAKCVRTLYSTAGAYGGVRPTINPRYNPNGEAWDYDGNNTTPDRHPPKTKVIGSSLIAFKPYGSYRAADLTGIFEYMNPARLVNYPMYFQPGYYDNLWDYFHWIDDPVNNPQLNQNISLKIPLCCDDLKQLKVFNDGAAVQLGQKIKTDNKWYADFKISEVTVSYDYTNDVGAYIEIKATNTQ